jgi:hypothetical protein
MTTATKALDSFNEWLKTELTKAGLKGTVYTPFIRSVLENEEIDDDSKWYDIKAYTAEQIPVSLPVRIHVSTTTRSPFILIFY